MESNRPHDLDDVNMRPPGLDGWSNTCSDLFKYGFKRAASNRLTIFVTFVKEAVGVTVDPDNTT